MAFSHRKILSVPPPQPNSGCQPSKNESPGVGYRAPFPPQKDDIPSSPSTPQKNNIPGSPSTPQENDIPSSPPMQDHRFTSAIMFGSVLLFALLCVVIAKNYRKRNSPAAGSGSSPVFWGTEEDFLDEDHGLQVDHPIWFINTIGLPQSVLDSITAFKFKMDEGLVDGTECSVCLGEFREDEDLRLLPKCSHAFHLPCIDTWLRSHKSCPLCRSPIVVDAGTGHTSLEEPGLSNSVSEVGGLIAENQGMSGNTQPRSESSRAGAADTGAGACQKQDGPIDERAKKVLSSSPSGNRGKLQISSESAGETSARARAMDMKIEPVRQKSSSVDVALLGILSTRAKRMKTVRYSSFGGSLQKGPIWMKRSCSCGGGRWSSRHSKSQSLEHSV